MESRHGHRRHRDRDSERMEKMEQEGEKKKVKKGILKNSGRHNSNSTARPVQAAGEYDVPNSSSSTESVPVGNRSKSHRNLSASCGTIDNLDFEPSYSQVKEKSRRKHREVEDVNIYDTPKVTSIKWREDLEAAYDMLARGTKNGVVSGNTGLLAPAEPSFYENIGFNVREPQDNIETEGVYDFPRPRNVDTVYFNDNFEDDGPTYDTPRKPDDIINYNHDEELDMGECDYDIPKVREATLTPIEEEECQEYDIPRNNKLIKQLSDENLYENQQFVNSAMIEHEPIYMNEIQDDRSSGYRSSSSPSIHSEENLYENGALLMDDFSSQDSQGSQENLIVGLEPELPERHDVAIETTHTLERLSSSSSSDNKKKHDPKTNNKDRRPSRENSRARTPEEGICLEFEEFNPEVTEKEHREQRLVDNGNDKKKLNHKLFKQNKEIDLFDNKSISKKSEKISTVIQSVEFEESSNVIYSKPEKKKKEFKNEINLSLKGVVNQNKTKNHHKVQKDIKPKPIITEVKNIESDSVSTNDILFEPIIETKINLADKIGLFESNKASNFHDNRNKNHINNHKKAVKPIKSEEKQRENFNENSKHQVAEEYHRKPTETTKPSKNGKERDRGVEVYMETVRQRSTVRDKKQLTTELFEKRQPQSQDRVMMVDTCQEDQDTHPDDTTTVVGLPSVRKLLARFENTPLDPGDNIDHGKAVTVQAANTRFMKAANNNIMHVEHKTNKNSTKKMSIVGTEMEKTKNVASPSFRAVEKRVTHSNQTVNHSQLHDEGSDDDENLKHEPRTKHWDPQYFVKALYRIPVIGESKCSSEEDGSISLDANQSCPSIEGYMERLPAGRKKSTMWNSWKKQYFVARNGVLYVYENKTQEVMTDKFEMFGGHVDFMDSNMLGLQDRRGQYIVVRCVSHRAAQEWESALSFHTMEDYSNTFVCPSPIPRNFKLLTNVIVIDLGGASVRAGICGADPYMPKLFFPSLMAVHPGNNHEKYFGFDALKPEIRSTCNLSYPLLPSKKVDKYSVDLVALCGLLLRVFKDLQVDPKKYELQLSVPRNFNDKTKAAIASLLFDEFEVPAVNMGHQTVFALHSYRTDTGVVVDIGERMDVVPIVAGYKVQSGISRTTTGGVEMVTHMKHALLGRNYSLTSHLDSYVVRHVIEKLCYIPKSYDSELEKVKMDPEFAVKSVTLDEGSSSPITIGVDRFEITEGIFKPELWGLDQAGIHVLVKKAIAECSLDARKEVTRSIFLSGGTTMIPGFNHRLETELEKLLPVRPKVHASPYRYHAAFLGASYHANTAQFHQDKIKRQDWVSGHAKNVASLWIL